MSQVILPYFKDASLQGLATKYPITCPIPDDLEPEAGYLLTDMSHAYHMEDALYAHGDIHPIEGSNIPKPNSAKLIEIPENGVIPHDGFLTSIPQDTVDDNGMPTQLITAANLEKRRRFNLDPTTGRLIRHDVSYKTAGKTHTRQEWEADSDSLRNRSAEKRAQAKLRSARPEIVDIDPDCFRSLGVCIASRATTYFAYELSDQSACLIIEAQKDACAFADPHVSMLLGYRREMEIEAVSVRLPGNTQQGDPHIKNTLKQGMAELDNIIMSETSSVHVQHATESKGAHAARLSHEFYRSNLLWRDYSDESIALMQNITIESFLGKINALIALSKCLPTPVQLANANSSTNFVRAFRDSPQLTLVA